MKCSNENETNILARNPDYGSYMLRLAEALQIDPNDFARSATQFYIRHRHAGTEITNDRESITEEVRHAWLPENGDAVRHEPSVLAGGTAHFAALAASEMGHRYPKYRTIFEAWWPHAATAIAGTERRSLVQITDANGEQVTGENGEVKTNLVVEGLCVNSVVFNARKARDLIHRSYERFLGELSPLQTQGVLERDKPMKIGQPVSISVQTRQPELVGVS